jgi:phospholipid/cholesterol/gamma-HCH transport system substrate-binding protein
MEKFFTPFKVGLLVLAGASILYFSFSEVRKDRSGGYTVNAVLSDAAELEPNSAVKIAGITVGEIKKIGLTDDGRAKVAIRMNDEYRLHFPCDTEGKKRQGAVASKTTSSLLGSYYIELSPGFAKCPELQDGDTIPTTVEATSIEDLSAQIKDILPEIKATSENIRVVSESIREAVGDPAGREALKEMVKDIERIADRIDKTVETQSVVLERVMANAEGITADLRDISSGSKEDLKITLANVREITDDIKEFTGGPATLPGAEAEGTALTKADSVLGKLDSAADKLDASLANIESITKKVDEGHGVAGMLINDDETKDNLKGTVDEVSEFAQSITRLHTYITMGTEFNAPNVTTDYAGGFRSYLGVKLQPKPDKFYFLELTDTPDGRDVFERETTLNPDGTTSVTETRTNRDVFRFSFQMGLRWRFMTFRFGIRDNTGGLGLDFTGKVFRRPIEFQTDLFDFAPEDLFALARTDPNDPNSGWSPRLRALVSTPLPLRGFYLVGGLDNILNSPAPELEFHQRAWFLGLQYRFDDQDLKALLTVAPTPSL